MTLVNLRKQKDGKNPRSKTIQKTLLEIKVYSLLISLKKWTDLVVITTENKEAMA